MPRHLKYNGICKAIFGSTNYYCTKWYIHVRNGTVEES
jgi:hypothetical protein